MSTTDTTPQASSTAQRPATPILILIRGLPGSGKSHLAAELQKRIGSSNVVTLDPDATDYSSKAYTDLSKSLTQEGVDAKFHPYRFLRGQAYTGITERKVIIWNQGFTSLDGFNKTIINLQAFAAEHGTTLPVLVVEVEVTPAVAQKRIAQRADKNGHDVPEQTFKRFLQDYQTFAGQGHNPVVVNGEDDVAVSAAVVMQALHDLTK